MTLCVTTNADLEQSSAQDISAGLLINIYLGLHERYLVQFYYCAIVACKSV